MAEFIAKKISEQNITAKLAQINGINNTDLQTAKPLTDVVTGILGNEYSNINVVQQRIAAGEITLSTYGYFKTPKGLYPTEIFVDTAENYINLWGNI
jgi:hypothetical protein